MNDQDLLDEMKKLIETEEQQQEAEKQISTQSFTSVQGQIAGLIHVLRAKGVLQKEDVKVWEQKSEQSSNLMLAIIKHNNERQQGKTIEEVMEATKRTFLCARALSMIMGEDPTEIDGQIQLLDDQYTTYLRGRK